MHVILQPYQSDWPLRYKQAAAALHTALPAGYTLEHIGSTAVPGLTAKPIIDILLGVAEEETLNRLPELLRQIDGYHYIAYWEDVMPFRRFFIRRDSKFALQIPAYQVDEEPTGQLPQSARSVHLHAVWKQHPFFAAHLKFRDLLRSDTALRQQYAALKNDLAARSWERISDYAAAKSTFIENALGQACADGP